jgi:hypothetical protein
MKEVCWFSVLDESSLLWSEEEPFVPFVVALGGSTLADLGAIVMGVIL